MVLGLTFLVVKFFEYKHKFELNHVPGPNFEFEGRTRRRSRSSCRSTSR